MLNIFAKIASIEICVQLVNLNIWIKVMTLIDKLPSSQLRTKRRSMKQIIFCVGSIIKIIKINHKSLIKIIWIFVFYSRLRGYQIRNILIRQIYSQHLQVRCWINQSSPICISYNQLAYPKMLMGFVNILPTVILRKNNHQNLREKIKLMSNITKEGILKRSTIKNIRIANRSK